ncbi:hypothetical protein [Rhizorhabdus dicambivorans]|uniref:Beta-barrel porin 2 n=1 Tax=Rhizorhabdus dicambivorans TaxID=1850238 RepID=A0A2A4FSS3_9SPHN|nr:hypothetical protein [Rhizorhabdus dicambivorans]ATE67022.1 hypothetical protein CMV14_23610 [Rhizorhabdus dicambivorans]PCE40498.1 hypothetical protein COO09_20020 [Rhizorhabdus dicambivorans]
MSRHLHPVALGGLAALALLHAASPAFAKAEFSVESEVRLGYDVNPFLTAGNDLASPYVKGSVNPRLTQTDSQGQTTLDAYIDRTEYLKRYGGTNEYGAELATQRKVSPKLSVYGSLRYDSEVIGLGDDEVTGQPTDAVDVNLIGLRRRADTYSASGGWEYQATPKDTISANGGYTMTRYGNSPAGNDTDNIGGSLAWKHAINARTKIGVRGSVYRIDYDTPGLSTLIMQPTVTFSTLLSATWKLDLSAGVTFSDLSVPAPLMDSRKTGFAASAQLCHTGAKDYFCLFGDRSVSASGVGGTVVRDQIGVTYRRSLDERLGFVWNGTYARSQSQAGGIGTRHYVSGRAGLDWQVARNLKIGAEGRYRDIYGQGFPVKADIGGDIYATIQLQGR